MDDREFWDIMKAGMITPDKIAAGSIEDDDGSLARMTDELVTDLKVHAIASRLKHETETLSRTELGDWRLERVYSGDRHLRVEIEHRLLDDMVPEPPRIFGVNIETPEETERRYTNTARAFLRRLIDVQERQAERAAIAHALRLR